MIVEYFAVTENNPQNKFIMTKDMTIAEVLKRKPAAAGVFFVRGMHCLGCSIALSETVEAAADVHGIDLDELLQKINEA